MLKFNEWIDKKEREGIKHLKIIKKLLESQGMKVTDYLKDDDPYIFVLNPTQNADFDGIRVYQIGSQLAFRIQKEAACHPFGQAYELSVEEMFKDLMSDHRKPEVAGKKLIEAVTEEVKNFFTKSAEAERDLRNMDFSGGADPMNKIAIRSSGTDFSNFTYTR